MIYHDVITEQLTRIIADAVRQELNRELLAPAGISVRHIHLERKRINQLFDYGHRLRAKKVLSQSGQYAHRGTLDVIGPRGILKGIRVLGPERDQSQVKAALADVRVLGVTPPVRASGDLAGMPGIPLRGLEEGAALEQGVVIADYHIHMSLEDVTHFYARDKELVQVEIGEEKPGTMDHVGIRASSDYVLDFHIDTDGGNTLLLKQGQPVKVLTVQEKE